MRSYILFVLVIIFLPSSALLAYDNPGAIIIDSITVLHKACDAYKGELIVHASGSAGLQYSIDGGLTYQSSSRFVDLEPNDFLVLVSDGGFCTEISSVQLLSLGIFSKPTIACPPNLEVECNGSNISDLVNDWILYSDARDFRYNKLTVSLETNLDLIATDMCSRPQVISIMTKDFCGQESTCETSIEVVDQTVPIVQCPSDVSINLENADWVEQAELWIESIQMSDNCSSKLTAAHDFDPSKVLLNCELIFTKEIIFEVADEYDNKSICSASIHFKNALEPQVVCNEPLEINCNDEFEDVLDRFLIQFEELNAFDEDISVSNDSNIEDIKDLKCGESVIVYFSVVDQCDRAADCSSTITVDDSESPVITFCPEPKRVIHLLSESRSQINEWILGLAATDNCSDLVYKTNLEVDILDNLCEQESLVDIEFSANDLCGNTSSCHSSLLILPQTISLSCPSELTIECGQDNNQLITDWLSKSSALLNDALELPVINDYDNQSIIDCNTVTPVTFVANTFCGSEDTCISSIRFVDTAPPVIVCPADLIIDIIDSDKEVIIDDWLSKAQVSDNCTSSLEIEDTWLEDTQLECNTEYVVTFSSTDDCGLTSVCVSNLSVVYDEIVTLDCPSELVYKCDTPNVESQILSDLMAVTDAYTLLEVTHDFSGVDIGNCLETQTHGVIFSTRDLCAALHECHTTLTLMPNPQLYIPSVFSSEAGNAQDRYFSVYGNEAVESVLSVSVFDRWGREIWYSEDVELNDYSTGWKGVDNHDTGPTTYVYKVGLLDIYGNEMTKMAAITHLK